MACDCGTLRIVHARRQGGVAARGAAPRCGNRQGRRVRRAACRRRAAVRRPAGCRKWRRIGAMARFGPGRARARPFVQCSRPPRAWHRRQREYPARPRAPTPGTTPRKGPSACHGRSRDARRAGPNTAPSDLNAYAAGAAPGRLSRRSRPTSCARRMGRVTGPERRRRAPPARTCRPARTASTRNPVRRACAARLACDHAFPAALDPGHVRLGNPLVAVVQKPDHSALPDGAPHHVHHCGGGRGAGNKSFERQMCWA